MKVLVLGSGGREHAIAWRLGTDPDVTEIVCAPGNPGMAQLGVCRPVDLADPTAMLALAERARVDLTIVGPEGALERGVADVFRRAGHAIVGPSRQAAALEYSKAHAKRFMAHAGIPTARFAICDTLGSALDAVSGSRFGFPVVVKADGLAAGKGVVIADDRAAAETAVRAAMLDRQFGDAGSTLVIEECLTGPEVSFFVLSDGERALPLASAQDHKRVADGDRGPNTGGMGAFAPSPQLTSALTATVMERIVQPVLDHTRAHGEPYRGFLYVSVMLTADGPQVIEFNVRFGDPEAQVVMPILKGPLARTLLASATGGLADRTLDVATDRSVGVVLASRDYPGPVASGYPITGLDRASARPGVLVFHAATRLAEGRLVSAGGRVLTVVGRGKSFEAARETAYDAVAEITFDGMQFRRDIGSKALGLGPAGALAEQGAPQT
jgi:phosphoribosylamine--glycine ligase